MGHVGSCTRAAEPRPRFGEVSRNLINFTQLNALGHRGSMSILAYHHMIPRSFGGHDAFDGIDKRTLGVESLANGIYLPVDYRLAKDMGISPHPGGHTELYYGAVKCALDRIAGIPEPDIRAAKIKALMDAMRVGFSKGELYTNVPLGGTQEGVEQGIRNVVTNNEDYVGNNPDSHRDLRDREQRGLETGHDHLLLWSAIQGHAPREELLDKAVEQDPQNITARNRHLGGTRYSKFTPVDDIFHIPPSTPANPADAPLPPPFFPPFLQWLNEPEGFTRNDPRFAGVLPAFPAAGRNEQQFGRLPPTTAAPSDPLVLRSDPVTGMPLPFYENPLAGGSSLAHDVLPWLAGAAAVGAAAPFIPAWLLAVGGILALSRAATAQEGRTDATMGAATSGEGVLSTGAPAYNTLDNGRDADRAAGDTALSTLASQSGGVSSFDPEAHAATLADRFGNWTSTPRGTMPAENPPEAAAKPAAASVVPEEARRLIRINESNAGSVFTSGSAPVPYLPPTEFNERFGNWTVPTADGGPPQTSKPIGIVADEPSYLIPPPIFGVDGPGNLHNGAEEWFSRWIRPLLGPE